MTAARDRYDEYYAARLWDWVPAIHRELDAGEGGDALRGLLAAIGSQAAVAKRSADRLWDDMFVELASDWAVPYIAELVATRLVSALDPRARRADVAKTIYYRRRKGTLTVLEQLVADIGGWDGKVVEEFRRLGRLRHGLDGPAQCGRLSTTPEGGLADLRQVRAALLTGGPFEEFHYTPETRRPSGTLGLRAIGTLGFHLYRQQSVELIGVQPRRLLGLSGTRAGYSFDPSGRDVPLFAGNTPATDFAAWHSAQEWELPRPIDCRLLNDVAFVVGDEAIAWILSTAPIANQALRDAAAADLRKLMGQRFGSRAAFTRLLAGLPQAAVLNSAGVRAGLLQRCLVNECGAAALLPGANGQAAFGPPALQFGLTPGLPVARERSRGAQLEAWPDRLSAGLDLLVDPARGRAEFDPGATPDNALRVRYRVGMAMAVGAGAYGREIDPSIATVHWAAGNSAAGLPAVGVAEVDDSSSFLAPPAGAALQQTTLRAAEGQRPYLRLNGDWVFTAAGNNRRLVLDGLWLGSLVPARLVLAGDWAEVRLRYCTLDPGGLDGLGAALPPLPLVVSGTVDRLVIERSVIAGIQLQAANASVDTLILRDSIVDAARMAAPLTGVVLPRTEAWLERCTLVGAFIHTPLLRVERLTASDTLVAGVALATDAQGGCFRFSARALGSQVPHPYESHTLNELARLFCSRRFGDPVYLSLAPHAPAGLAAGSEQGSEIGAGCSEAAPIKFTSLRAKVDEYMPFGRLAAYL